MNKENIDLEDIRMKLYERLKPSGWANKLKGFLLSDEFMSILEELLKQAQANKRFTPIIKDLFRAFEECPYENLKVVIVGQDPYPNYKDADGIAFSARYAEKVPFSLKIIFKELENSFSFPEGYRWDKDLTRWANQGILLLNTALTTTMFEPGTHLELWKPFTNYLFEILSKEQSGLVYAFLGSKSKVWSEKISDSNIKLYAMHPAAAAHAYGNVWVSNNIFSNIDESVKKQFNYQIQW